MRPRASSTAILKSDQAHLGERRKRAMHKAFFCAVLWFAIPAHAEIYRCIDTDGRSFFTDRPGACSTPIPVRLKRELIGRDTGEAQAASIDHRPQSAGLPNHSTLSEHFLPSSELFGQWSVLLSSLEPVDPELRKMGLRDTVERHYTRVRGPISEVCTIEMWVFTQAETARRAAVSLELPNWKILRADEILILVHGVLLERGVGSRSDLAADCEDLGQRTYERVAGVR